MLSGNKSVDISVVDVYSGVRSQRCSRLTRKEDKVRKQKEPKAPKETPWKNFSDVDRKVIPEFSHFTSKAVNSNSSSFGIRLSPRDRIDLPYVAVRTMDVDSVPVDYFHGGQTMKAFRQFSWAKRKASGSEGKDVFSGATQEDLAYIEKTLGEMSERHETKSTFVGLRLRQVIVQTETGEDVVLTPLPSPGFSEVLRNRIEEERTLYGASEGKDKNEVMDNRVKGFIGIGGGNPQNVGGYVSSMQSPLFFSPPKEEKKFRAFFGMVNSHLTEAGMKRPRLSGSILLDFYKWRERILALHRGVMPGDFEIREEERVFIARLVSDLEEQAVRSSSLIDDINKERYQKSIDLLMTDPWINPSERDNDWIKAESERIHRDILHTKFFNGEDFCTIGVGEKDSLRWIDFIREELR